MSYSEYKWDEFHPHLVKGHYYIGNYEREY